MPSGAYLVAATRGERLAFLKTMDDNHVMIACSLSFVNQPVGTHLTVAANNDKFDIVTQVVPIGAMYDRPEWLDDRYMQYPTLYVNPRLGVRFYSLVDLTKLRFSDFYNMEIRIEHVNEVGLTCKTKMGVEDLLGLLIPEQYKYLIDVMRQFDLLQVEDHVYSDDVRHWIRISDQQVFTSAELSQRVQQGVKLHCNKGFLVATLRVLALVEAN